MTVRKNARKVAARVAKEVEAAATIDELSALLQEDTLTGADLTPALARFYEREEIEDAPNAQINVSLIEADGDSRVWSGPPDEYDLMALAKAFGSGKYRVKIFIDNEQGKKPMRGHRVFSVKISPLDERKRQQIINAPLASAAAGGIPDSMSGVVSNMMVGFENAVARLVAAMPRSDPDKDFDRLAKLIEVTRPAVVAPAPARTLLEVVSEMEAVARLGQRLNPPARPVDGTVGAIERGVELLGKALDASTQRASQGAPAIDSSALETPEEGYDMNLMLKMHLASGVSLARANADVDDYARNSYDALTQPQIIDMCGNQFWFRNLCALYPKCADFPEWFRRVHLTIVGFALADNLITRDVYDSVVSKVPADDASRSNKPVGPADAGGASAGGGTRSAS